MANILNILKMKLKVMSQSRIFMTQSVVLFCQDLDLFFKDDLELFL